MEILFLTGNENKFKEAAKVLLCLKRIDVDLAEIQSINPKEIITHKLNEARSKYNKSLVVEDTSLFLNCMKGLPGPLIKWFLETVGQEGLVQIAESLNDFGAEARVTIGFATDNGAKFFFEGSILGKIVRPRGNGGFGWDSIFEPEGKIKTFAEMTIEEKNEISMRKIAFQKLKDFLLSIR